MFMRLLPLPLLLSCQGKAPLPVDSAHPADTGVPVEDVGATPCDAVLWSERGLLTLGASLREVPLASCRQHRYALVAPAGAVLSLELRGAALGVEAALTWPDHPGWDETLAWLPAGEEGASRSFTAPRAGEFALLVRTREEGAAGTYDLSVACEEGCDALATRYPVVLVHGWTGWDEVQSYTYFYGVEEHLEEAGAQVFVASLDPYNSCEVRATQLAEQVDGFLAEAHANRVNLIAHSQGGLDSRMLISSFGYGDRVASLTTISTPHQGTPLADMALGLLPGVGEEMLAWLLNWLGATTVGSQSDALASFDSLSEATVQGSFNAENPDDPRVAYLSYAGHTCTLGLSCDDLCDVEIQLPHQLLSAWSGDNDGIVPVESAIWGDWRGELPADHFDEVGQLFGVTGPHFDHRAFYLGVVEDLAAEGR
ncbi:MAG: triacylglycerol lipase [Deltaproteobacteria bacterium]|nr:triacylglycerol lipase [Deltaproteobacteria bacterium]